MILLPKTLCYSTEGLLPCMDRAHKIETCTFIGYGQLLVVQTQYFNEYFTECLFSLWNILPTTFRKVVEKLRKKVFCHVIKRAVKISCSDGVTHSNDSTAKYSKIFKSVEICFQKPNFDI